MNPSAYGWIKKHLPNFEEFLKEHPVDELTFYKQLRASGFIYGHSVNTLVDEKKQQLKWTTQEKTKINLFDALAFTYYDTIDNPNTEDCLKAIISFYKTLDKKERYFIKLGLGSESDYSKVEKIIHQRIQTNESTLQKNFSHLITNALLYVDILSFDHYLITQEDPYHYAQSLEAILLEVVYLALQQKESKDSYNELLIKLFESSVRYNTIIKSAFTTIDKVDLSEISEPLEIQYIMDLCGLSLWDDQQIDAQELDFMTHLCLLLRVSKDHYKDAIAAVKEFLSTHNEEISYLNYSNPVKHFYNQTTSTVGTLITRNKNRLIKEISQSRDLVILLGQSTQRDLTKKERKIVKEQLLDIFKTIPSLAIFILPGGGLLLPIFVRLVPKLLPSAFNENLED